MAQVLHITGSLDKDAAEAARTGLPAGMQSRYHVFDYLHEDMGAALAAADLAVTRAGASTLGEYPLFGLPAILVPYQYAWRYQKVNADYLQQNGAALILEAGQLADQLLPTLRGLFSEPQRLQSMRQAMASLARPNAAGEIAGLLQDLAGEPLGERGAQSW
jgi:UDP-N-acetylglucosamine--N-acetylmuramyl-(pentapeptide) pyrophosphoryl-undecaprenol N-acetylglucosamine transferase